MHAHETRYPRCRAALGRLRLGLLDHACVYLSHGNPHERHTGTWKAGFGCRQSGPLASITSIHLVVLGPSGDGKQQQSCAALGHWLLPSVESPSLMHGAQAASRIGRSDPAAVVPRTSYIQNALPRSFGNAHASEATMRANRLRKAPKRIPSSSHYRRILADLSTTRNRDKVDGLSAAVE